MVVPVFIFSVKKLGAIFSYTNQAATKLRTRIVLKLFKNKLIRVMANNTVVKRPKP